MHTPQSRLITHSPAAKLSHIHVTHPGPHTSKDDGSGSDDDHTFSSEVRQSALQRKKTLTHDTASPLSGVHRTADAVAELAAPARESELATPAARPPSPPPTRDKKEPVSGPHLSHTGNSQAQVDWPRPDYQQIGADESHVS